MNSRWPLLLVRRRAMLPFLTLAFLSITSLLHAQRLGDVQVRRVWSLDGIQFHNQFSGARLSEMRRIQEGRYLAVSRAEFRPINPSPWYAFDITTPQATNIELLIQIDAANDFRSSHPVLLPSRPWLSVDQGTTWEQLDAEKWTRGDIASTARLALQPGTTRVAAFRPHTLERVMEWCDEWERLPFVRGSKIGTSAEGRPLRHFTIAETEEPHFLVLLAGQHPPEGDGDRGLVWFANELRADTSLARAFRQNFQTVVVPMINPDGKFHGHWRGTLGGKDPNRDWTDQTLIEVATVARFLRETCAAEGAKVWCMIDFHATNRDFFYVDSGDSPENPSTFAARWFSRVTAEEGGFQVKAVPSPNQNAGTSTSWSRRVLRAPSYTREFIYGQEEDSIRAKSRDEARALMRLLLEERGIELHADGVIPTNPERNDP